MSATRPGMLSGYAFLVIFPGFILYQTLVDAGAFAPSLGGFFTAACVAALPVALYEYARSLGRVGVAPNYIGPMFFSFLTIFVIALVNGIVSGADPEITGSHAAYFIKFIALFLIARLMNPWAPRFQRLALTAYFLICVGTLWRVFDGNILAVELARQLNEEFQLDYQGMAHAFLVLTLFCLPALGRRGRALVYVLALPVMFVMGARSELVALLLAAGVIEFCKSRSRPLFLILAASVLALSSVLLSVAVDALPEHRVLNLLQLSEDQSAQERAEYSATAWKTIESSPLLGGYASYQSGTYAHNILSAWVDLGLAGFLLLSLLMLLPAAGLIRDFGRHGRSDDYALVLACLAATALLILFAKTYHYQLLPLTLGLYSRRLLLSSRHRVRFLLFGARRS